MSHFQSIIDILFKIIRLIKNILNNNIHITHNNSPYVAQTLYSDRYLQTPAPSRVARTRSEGTSARVPTTARPQLPICLNHRRNRSISPEIGYKFKIQYGQRVVAALKLAEDDCTDLIQVFFSFKLYPAYILDNPFTNFN